MKNEAKLITIEWIENDIGEPTLLLNLKEASSKNALYCDVFAYQWPISFLSSISIHESETEQHADFTVTRFIFNNVLCLLTIDTICESIWISALTQAVPILTALKVQIEKEQK